MAEARPGKQWGKRPTGRRFSAKSRAFSTPCSPSIDPADFGGPIDNPYLPLRPGTLFR